MQCNGAAESEVAIDKRVDAPPPALDVSLHGIAHDRAGELIRGYVRHPFTTSTAALI
jgi:hypothetical protein